MPRPAFSRLTRSFAFAALYAAASAHPLAAQPAQPFDGCRAITVGGLGLNAIKDSKQVEGCIARVDRLNELARQPGQPVTVHLTTHPFSTGLMEARDRLAARKPGEANPLVDPEGLLKQLAGLRSGAEARLDIERKTGR